MTILTKEQLAEHTGFTDGPWSVAKDFNVYAGDPQKGHRSDVADVVSDGSTYMQDARLIAAAPDLLATALHLYAEVERLTKEKNAACLSSDGYKSAFHAALDGTDDVRPMATGHFLAELMKAKRAGISDDHDIAEAVKSWVNGDWSKSMEFLEPARMEASHE